jgi:hypothetical protein
LKAGVAVNVDQRPHLSLSQRPGHSGRQISVNESLNNLRSLLWLTKNRLNGK